MCYNKQNDCAYKKNVYKTFIFIETPAEEPIWIGIMSLVANFQSSASPFSLLKTRLQRNWVC